MLSENSDITRKKNGKVIYTTEIEELFKLKRRQEINSIQYPNPLDEFPDLTEKLISLKIAGEQKKMQIFERY